MLASCLAKTRCLGVLGVQSCRTALYSIQVTIPPLGDSISEGSISAVLKQAGDSVQENEPIAQVRLLSRTSDADAAASRRSRVLAAASERRIHGMHVGCPLHAQRTPHGHTHTHTHTHTYTHTHIHTQIHTHKSTHSHPHTPLARRSKQTR
jgi:hypothetical protein